MSDRPPTPEELRAKVRAVQTAEHDSPEQKDALMALMDVKYTFRHAVFAALVDRLEALAERWEGGAQVAASNDAADALYRCALDVRAALNEPLDTEDDDA